MSSELELTEAGRLRLAFLIAQEKQRPIRESYKPLADLAPWAVKVLANEERRLKAAGERGSGAATPERCIHDAVLSAEPRWVAPEQFEFAVAGRRLPRAGGGRIALRT